MRIPKGRTGAIVAVSVALVVALSWPLWSEPFLFVVKLVVPGPSSRAADDRASDPPSRVGGQPPVSASTSTTGATTAGGVSPTPPKLKTILVGAIDSPISVADPRGPGPILVATQAGQVLAVGLTNGEKRTLADISGKITSGGERGLLGIAIDPEGKRLYANFTDKRGDTRIVSWPVRGSAERPEVVASEEVEHLRIGQPFSNHNGGNLVFGPDGALWIGTGDGGGAGDPNGNAQRRSTLLGKMLRVIPDPAGGVRAAMGNAEAWPGEGRPEIWAIGLRNPWRYSFDRATGQLWVADVGQGSIEEVTVVDPAAKRVNFGWNIVEGNNRYEGRPHAGLSMPQVTYPTDEGCAVTGGYVYRGKSFEALNGWYLFSDYCAGWIRAVAADDPKRTPRELAADVGNVMSFAELEDGEILLCTREGLFGLVPAE